MKYFLLTVFSFTIAIVANTQILNPVTWSYAAKKSSAVETSVYLKAKVATGWHIYAQNIPNGKDVSTFFNFYPSKDYKVIGTTAQPKPITQFEEGLGLTISYFKDSVIFMQKVKLNKIASTAVKGEVTYMVCDASRCLPPKTISFNIPVR